MTTKQRRLQTEVNLKRQSQQRTIEKKLNTYKKTLKKSKRKFSESTIDKKLQTREEKLQEKASDSLASYRNKLKSSKKYREGKVDYTIDTTQLRRPSQKEGLINSRIKRHLSGDVKKDNSMLLKEFNQAVKNINKFGKLGYDFENEPHLYITVDGKKVLNPSLNEISQLDSGQKATLMQTAKDINRRSKELENFNPNQKYDIVNEDGETESRFIDIREYAKIIDQIKKMVWHMYQVGMLDSKQARAVSVATDKLTVEHKVDVIKEYFKRQGIVDVAFTLWFFNMLEELGYM